MGSRVAVTDQGHAFGWRPDLPDHRDMVVAPPTPEVLARIAATSRVDLSLNPWMPGVWDQSRIGSCTAHSSGVTYEYAAHASGHHVGTPSRLFIYYHERLLEGTVNEDSGAEIRDGFKVLAAGVPPETDWPYDIAKFAAAPPPRAETDARKHPTTVYQRVSQTEQAIKAVLLAGGPKQDGRLVSFGFTVYDSFETQTVAQSGLVPMPARGEGVLGGHATAIVGYDDGLSAYGLTGFYKVRNSWGTAWGIGGYFWMPYLYIHNRYLCSDFWTATVAT